MSQVLIDPSSLTAIGDAIRSKNKQVVKYKPNEMAGAIKALALDNSVVIQSNDAWKYAIDSTLEHQSITVKVSGKLTGDKTTGYKGEVIFDPYITSNFGWLAGKIKQTVDDTNHVITFSAEAATEISGMLQDGWTPVYVVDGKYYTTTTPDNISSLKSVSSSDNIENLLICGYYTLDKSNNKLVSTEPTTYSDIDSTITPYPVSDTATKKLRDNYLTDIGDSSVKYWTGLKLLEELYLPNVKSVGNDSLEDFKNLKILHIPNLETINGRSTLRTNILLSSYYLPKLKVVANSSLDGGWPYHDQIIYLKDVTSFGGANIYGSSIVLIINNTTPPDASKLLDGYIFTSLTILVPSAAIDTYKNNTSFSKVLAKSNVKLYSMENYDININQENSQITVVPLYAYSSFGPFDAVLNGENITITTINTSQSSTTKALTLPDDDGKSIIVCTLSTTVLGNDWTDANLNKLTITRESDGHGITFTLGFTDGGSTITSWDYNDKNTNTVFKCARYDVASAVEHGCTLNDLIKSANNGDKLKLTFTSN